MAVAWPCASLPTAPARAHCPLSALPFVCRALALLPSPPFTTTTTTSTPNPYQLSPPPPPAPTPHSYAEQNADIKEYLDYAMPHFGCDAIEAYFDHLVRRWAGERVG